MNADALGWTIAIVGGYLLGSIPFGLLIGRAKGIDPRTAGSGNIGATNVMRVVGRGPGALCFALDVAKGLAPPLIAGLAFGLVGRDAPPAGDAWLWMVTAAAPIAGHCFPVWLRFKGGKGVATGFGAALGVWPALGAPVLAALVVWMICRGITRNVGFSSSVAAIVMPFLVAGIGILTRPLGVSTPGRLRSLLPFLVVAAFLSAVVLWRHRENLKRTYQARTLMMPRRDPSTTAPSGKKRAGAAPTSPPNAG